MWSIQDKSILITGSTDGIGKAAAEELARLGARVIVHGKSADRCARVAGEIQQLTGNKNVEWIACDLASLGNVAMMAEQIRARYGHLQVLVNNAGVYMQKRVLTAEGNEVTFAVNHLAHFHLTNLLLDVLKTSAPSRIINVTSVAHTRGRIEFDNLQGEKDFGAYEAYALSKLGNVLFTVELAERLKESGVTVNCLHPGVIGTKLLAAGFPNLSGASVQDGARTIVYLASSDKVTGVTGKYFSNMREEKPSTYTRDLKLRERFWRVSEELVKAKRAAA